MPCFNEGDHLPETIAALPRSISGIDTIEYLVIDDGSRDNTSEVARRLGVHHVVRHRTNRGPGGRLPIGTRARARAKAPISSSTPTPTISMTAATSQPWWRRSSAARRTSSSATAECASNAHFGPVKRQLQRLGSAIVRRLSNTRIPDAVSGFRAMSREAAQRINITSDFSYTTEMLIQAGRKRMAVVSVPVRTNGAVRPSRLFRSIPHFIVNTAATMLRAWAMYNPLRAFVSAGLIAFLIGMAPMIRFLWFYFNGDGGGHIQSLIIGGVLMILGVITIMLGALADLIGRNRNSAGADAGTVRAIEERVDGRRKRHALRRATPDAARFRLRAAYKPYSWISARTIRSFPPRRLVSHKLSSCEPGHVISGNFSPTLTTLVPIRRAHQANHRSSPSGQSRSNNVRSVRRDARHEAGTALRSRRWTDRRTGAERRHPARRGPTGDKALCAPIVHHHPMRPPRPNLMSIAARLDKVSSQCGGK